MSFENQISCTGVYPIRPFPDRKNTYSLALYNFRIGSGIELIRSFYDVSKQCIKFLTFPGKEAGDSNQVEGGEKLSNRT